jgi:aspartate/methionine/tyrosine aminotransferase
MTARTLLGARALAIAASPTIGTADAAAEMRRSGIDVVDLSAGRAAEATPDYRFCMGGWRVGFALAPPPVLEAMLKVQQHLITCPTSFGQAAAVLALSEEPREELKALWRDWEKRTRHVAQTLDAFPGVSCAMPEGAFYAWADVRAVSESSERVAERLLREHRVAVVPGSAFGSQGEGFLRITCARAWDEIEEGLERLERGLSSFS